MAQTILGPDYDLAKRLQKIERDIAALNTRDVLQNASIGAGGLTVNGGTINITNGGSLIVTGTGTIQLATGTFVANVVDSNTTVNAGTDITAGGTVSGGTVNSSGNMSAGGNVTAGGQVTSAAALKSPGSKAYAVTHGYVVAYIDFDGTIGYTPSTEDSKKDLVPMNGAAKFLQVTPYWGRYTTDPETSPLKAFFLAEDIQAAGFGPDVVPLDDDGKPLTINYPQLVVPLLALIKTQQAQIDSILARLNTAGL